MPPVVAALFHFDSGLVANAFHHDHTFNRRAAIHCIIGHALERHDAAAPPAAVAGHEHVALGVIDAVGKGFSAESAKDDAVRRAYARAGQHGNREFGHHAHVERHTVAALHAETL